MLPHRPSLQPYRPYRIAASSIANSSRMAHDIAMANRVYLAIVEKDAGSAYGVSFPDVPGLFSAADDEADIVPNAVEALRLWEESETLPPPQNRTRILENEAVRADLANGATLVSVSLD